MFNIVTLLICFLFLMAVWKFQVPGATEEYSPAPMNPTPRGDESR